MKEITRNEFISKSSTLSYDRVKDGDWVFLEFGPNYRTGFIDDLFYYRLNHAIEFCVVGFSSALVWVAVPKTGFNDFVQFLVEQALK